MRLREPLALIAILALASPARAELDPPAERSADQAEPAPALPASPNPMEPAAANKPAQPVEGPVLTGSNQTEVKPGFDLFVFKGTILFNEFVYRAVLKLPPDATATPQTAREVRKQIAAFLHDAGYDLAKVRTRVVKDQIEVVVDEGALDKIIFTGAGWLPALRFRAALDMPLDVFNRRLFELQMPLLAKKYGLRSYHYELWAVHLIDVDNAAQLGDVDELRAMPMLQPARGYELRIFAETDPWSTGLSPEIVLNGPIGVGFGGRYRLKDLFEEGDRWQAHFRVGGAIRSHLPASPTLTGTDADVGSARPVNTNDYLTTRWLSRPWGGTSSGLRMTINPRAELWTLQRDDLHLDQFRIGWLELATGAGAQLTREFSLYVTAGLQRRWLADIEWAKGYSDPASPQVATVASVPVAEYRGLISAESTYTFNPNELRRDTRNELTLDVDAYKPTSGANGYVRIDAQGTKNFAFGWHELRTLLRVAGEFGNVLFVDEIPLDDHFRIGFGLEKFTQRIVSTRTEFRWSLVRDKIKVGPFTDVGVWRRLQRDDPNRSVELAGSSGVGAFFFIFDELQVDAFYGLGWSTDDFLQTGFNLQIKEAF